MYIRGRSGRDKVKIEKKLAWKMSKRRLRLTRSIPDQETFRSSSTLFVSRVREACQFDFWELRMLMTDLLDRSTQEADVKC